jgi:thiol-disulfide isomerase/thioredoxin
MIMPTLAQQINANKRRGGILGIEQQTPGSTVKPQSQLHHPFGRVHVVSSLTQLDELLERYRKSCAVVFFTSATCPPCKTLYPLYDDLAAEVGEKGALIKVDISHAFDVGRRYSVSATPTFITFLRGQQENRWSGADPSALRGNVQLLVQMAWPPHPHLALNLPSFSDPNNAEYVTFTKIPPLPKLLAKLGPTATDPSIQSIATFLETRAAEGPAEATLPNLASFTRLIRTSLPTLPTDHLFPLIDLLRCALSDPRVSGCLAEESSPQPHSTLTAILSHITTTLGPPSTCPYPLRLVTLQMACNLFTTHLYPAQILSHPDLRRLITGLITSSFLDESHPSVRVAAAGLLFNVALANFRTRHVGGGGGDGDGLGASGGAGGGGGKEGLLPEAEQVELAAAVLEAITQEEGSAEALEGMLRGLGWLVYCSPMEGEVVELVRGLEAGEVVKRKGEKFMEGVMAGLVREVGEVLLGKGLGSG